MKIRFLTLLLCLAACGALEAKRSVAKTDEEPMPMLAPKGTMLIGALVAPHHRNIPGFNVFFIFNGDSARTNSDGVFRCKTKRDITEALFVLVGQYSEPTMKKHNTVRRITVNPLSKHRLFKLMPDPADPRKWLVEEEDIKKYNYELPQQTIAVTINPEVVATGIPFETAVYQTNNKQLILPRLLLKNGLTNKELQRASAKSLLYPLKTVQMHPTGTVHKHQTHGKNGAVEISVLAWED